MYNAIRRRGSLVAALALTFACLVFVPAVATAATTPPPSQTQPQPQPQPPSQSPSPSPSPSPAPSITSAKCGSLANPCLSLNDIVCWESNWCPVQVTIAPYGVEPIRVGFATSDGTARAGVNYEPAQGVITIPARNSTATIPILLGSSRSVPGQPTYLYVTLFNPTSGTVIVDRAVVTIAPKE